ncbi:MAG TPA: glycoside hydrolase family 38 C-terminal domain-containing protein [Bacteroidota bacterium]|nr:glycoside hydrolase family 38 C-terminal domain-containing protein [Bacteroidota bacterium]
MNLLRRVVFCILVPAALMAQTNVDKLVKALDSLSLASFNDWKMSPDLKAYKPAGDPTQAGFDDSGWQTLKLNQNVYPDSCWLRKEIVLPAKILGKPVSGAMRFLVSVDDYGYLWVNGVSKGYFPWDGDFELTKDAKPGEHFLVAIKAINTGGPLRLLRAQIASEELKAIRMMIENLSLSLRVGQKLLSFDTYQTSSNRRVDPGTDKSAMDKGEKKRLNELLQSTAARFDLNPLINGPLDKFEFSVKEAQTLLLPVDAFAKRFTLYFDGNAHIDAAWLWRSKETIEVCKNTFASVLNIMDARPDITYTQSSAAYYDWIEKLYPDLFKRMETRIRDGRWEIIGGMWVEPDCNLPSGESWSRHLMYAKRYFQQKFGVDVKIGWNPDSFGYNWNMPQFYHDAGIDAFITQKIGWNDTNVFPYRLFWWEGPDGSRVLSYFPFDYVNEVKNGYQLVDWLRQFEANTGMTKMMVLFGVGDHGGGPSLEMMERIDELKKLAIFPKIEFGNATDYLDWIKKHDTGDFPVWKDELYLEYHQGTYTTQANMKKFNRSNEVLLTDAEKFSTLSTLSGRPYNASSLEEAWKKVLFNQFHDILPGSGIREVYIDAAETHQQAAEIGKHELLGSLQNIARHINTSKMRDGVPAVVFNPVSWDRSDVARIRLPEGDEATYAVFDDTGKEVPSQILQVGKYEREVLFVARNIPSMGYRTYQLKKQKPAAAANDLAVSQERLENQFFSVALDAKTGWVRSITDKRNGKEVLSGDGNELQLLADYPTAWDAWNVGLTGVKYPSTFRKAEVVESGPVRVVVRLSRDYLKPGEKKDFPTEDFPSSFFTQDVILYSGIDRIEFSNKIDWWEDKTFLKVAFPVAVNDSMATYEIPYGTIQRSTQMRNSWEKAKVEVPSRTWADLSDGSYGVSLLNNSKYGYDIKGNIMRLSLLRSPKWPDPTTDRGKHTIEYALYPHKGTWREANTVQRGYEFNYPLLSVLTDVHKGDLPVQQSFVQLTPSNLVLTGLKKAEDGDAWIVQWYDASGEPSMATVTFPRAPKRVVLSNFLEGEKSELAIEKNVVHVPTGKSSVVTIKVSF